jgi:hypothetical protein
MVGKDNWGQLKISIKNCRYCFIKINQFSEAATTMQVGAINAQIIIHFFEMAETMLGNTKKILTKSRPLFNSDIF